MFIYFCGIHSDILLEPEKKADAKNEVRNRIYSHDQLHFGAKGDKQMNDILFHLNHKISASSVERVSLVGNYKPSFDQSVLVQCYSNFLR